MAFTAWQDLNIWQKSMGPMNVTFQWSTNSITVKERSVTNFCDKYSVTENGKWNHAQENEETILKTAEYLSVNATLNI